MNCDQLASSTGWDCSPAGVRAIRAVAPMTLGADGQHAAFYIAQPTDNTFYITDASETAIHAEQIGIVLNKNRLDQLNRTCGVSLAKFQKDWSIEASGSMDMFQVALWDAVKLAMAISFKSESWRPKYAQAKFRAIVLMELQSQIGADRIIKCAQVKGSSGNIIEFPLSVKRLNGQEVFIQPVALENKKINWGTIYEAHGKLFDVKAASEINNRLAIIEDGASKLEFGRVASFLSGAAPVRTLGTTPSWKEVFS